MDDSQIQFRISDQFIFKTNDCLLMFRMCNRQFMIRSGDSQFIFRTGDYKFTFRMGDCQFNLGQLISHS